MYDTINMRLYADECRGVDFMQDLPQRLTSADINENKRTGARWLTGRLDNLKIIADTCTLQVRDGSLCKWYLGDNYQTLGKADTQRAIESLSDALGLPLELAFITRLDVATNMIMEHQPEAYLQLLGPMRYMRRLAEPNGIYYTQKTCRLIFYDKAAETRAQGDVIPALYDGRSVLRYEQRYTKRIARRLNRPELRAAGLYDDSLHRELVRRWLDGYRQIQKINKTAINFEMVKTKRDFYKLGLLSLIEKAGGANEMLAQIDTARKTGQLGSKQAYDLRAAVREACAIDGSIVRESELVHELDKKITEAALLYM